MWSSIVALFQSLPEITQAFVVVISIVTLLMIGPFYNTRTLVVGPTVLTMLGIFGCFLGIALGLMEFDTGDIQGSVPSLVEGIKTAFWASVAGVAGALLIKTRLLLFGPPAIRTEDSIEEATIDDLANLLRNLHQSLAGKEDSTLLSQTKLLRQENRDSFSSLQSSFDACMAKMADSNSKALIEALKEVIRDFNAKINEQFGENFKHLNASIEKLLVWQEQYKNQVDEMVALQKTTASSMSEATARYSEIVGETEKFTTAASKLSELITTLERQREQLSNSLTALSALLKSAGDGVPKLESRIVEMTRQIEEGVRSNNDQIKKLVVEVAEHVNKDVNTHMKQLAENTKNQVVALDKALSDELSKSITTLGQHLTALSKHFVDDYTPLTDRLRDLVHSVGRA